jgi:hypothetical protein
MPPPLPERQICGTFTASKGVKVIFSTQKHAEHAAALGVSLDTALKAKYPGSWAKNPNTARERLQTYLVYIPEGDPFEVFLDADDALVTDDSDQRRVDRLIKKITKRLASS